MPSYALSIDRRCDGLFVGRFPDIPGVLAYGSSQEEVVAASAESLRATLQRMFLTGESLLEPRSRGEIEVEQDVLEMVLA